MVKKTVLHLMLFILSTVLVAQPEKESNTSVVIDQGILLWSITEVYEVFGEPDNVFRDALNNGISYIHHIYDNFEVVAWSRYPNRVESILVETNQILLFGFISVGQQLSEILSESIAQNIQIQRHSANVYRIFVPEISNNQQSTFPVITLVLEDGVLIRYSITKNL
jgi:hypothetical protein